MRYLLLLFVLLPSVAFAHPGGLDANMGHYCWTKCEEKYGITTGSYHYHNDGNTNIYTDPVVEEPEPALEPQYEQESEPAIKSAPETTSAVEPIEESAPAPKSISESIGTAAATLREPQATKEIEATAPQVLQEIAEEATVTARNKKTETETAGASDIEETQESSAAAGIVILLILGGMGYGGYRGIKAIARRIKKKAR